MAANPEWMPRSWKEADRMLNSSSKSRTIGHNTTLRREHNGDMVVTLYATDIVRFTFDGDIIYDCEYDSNTTKRRLNAVGEAYFFHKKRRMYADYRGVTFPAFIEVTIGEAFGDLEEVV